MSVKLSFVTMPFPGVVEYLRHGKAVGLWDMTVLGSERVEVAPADAYGVGAWCQEYGAVHDEVRKRGASFGVAWTSSPQESDASRTQVELLYLMALTSEKSPYRPDWFMCLHPALAEVLPGGFHVPAPICMEEVKVVPKEDRIAFYSPGTEKKAVFSQLLAVKAFQKERPEFILDTNLASYEKLMQWLGIRYELRSWMPRGELLERLAACRFAMHASLAESFGYGAVDAMMAGTPVVGSPALQWLPRSWCARDANDPASILSQMRHACDSEVMESDAKAIIDSIAGSQNYQAKEAAARLHEYINSQG